MKKLIIASLLPLILNACQTTQNYSVPLKNYLSNATIPARIETMSSLKRVCANEFVLDRKTGAIIGTVIGAIASNGFGAPVLLTVATYSGIVGHNVGKSQEPNNNGYHEKCLPSGYEVRINYYHPDSKELVSHYIVMDKRVQHATVNIPMSWIPSL